MLSSDDAWYPEKLAIQIPYMEDHPNIAAVFGKVDWIDEDGHLITDEGFLYKNLFDVENRTRQEWLALFFKFGNCLCHPSSLIRRDAYFDIGLLNPSFANLPDFDLWVRICLKYDIMILDKSLIRYRWMSDHSNASSNTKQTNNRYRFEYKQMLDHYLKITTPEELLAIFPEAAKYGNVTRETIPYFLGRVAIETGLDLKMAWGQETIFALLQNEKIARTLEENCSFTYLDFINLTSENDIYHHEILQILSTQVIEQQQAIQGLNAQVISSEQIAHELRTQITEMKNSRTWKVALLLQRIRLLLAPPGSLRTRILGQLRRVLLLPFTKPNRDKSLEENLSLLRSSNLFDETWYLAHYPDVIEAKIDPVRHYLLYGGLERRDPGPHFSSGWYLDRYEDVKRSGINPLVHFLRFGLPEGRITHESKC
jgi:hypothetical protein